MRKNTVIFALAAVMLLASCSEAEQPNEETTISETTTAAETTSAVTEISETQPTEEFTTAVSENNDSYVIYWQENGVEKSETLYGFVYPDTIIQEVIKKHIGDDIELEVYAADWLISEYYEDVSSEDGLIRNVYYTGMLDISDGYSSIIGEEQLEAVTTCIAKSFISTYNLESIRVCELREDIVVVEK